MPTENKTKQKTYCAGVVMQIKVSLSFALLWFWFAKARMFAQVIRVQLLLEGLIGGLWYDTLFFQDRENTQRLLDQVNASLQIETKVHHLPLDALFLVFFLFQNEHKVIEKLLQSFVGEVDAKLFKTIVLFYNK